MKIEVMPSGYGPDKYEFDGDIVTIHRNGEKEDFDLSELEKDDRFDGVDPDTLNLSGSRIIRNAHRDEDGELHVIICQPVIGSKMPRHKAIWMGSDDEFDSRDYDPDQCYVVPSGVSNLTEGEDYELVWMEGLAKDERGWTIRPVKEGK